jgi:hypothetical protein
VNVFFAPGGRQDETLAASEATTNALRKKGDDSSLNAVVQSHGIAHHWKTLTDALGRALVNNWAAANKRVAGLPGVGAEVPGGIRGGRPADSGSLGTFPQGPAENTSGSVLKCPLRSRVDHAQVLPSPRLRHGSVWLQPSVGLKLELRILISEIQTPRPARWQDGCERRLEHRMNRPV